MSGRSPRSRGYVACRPEISTKIEDLLRLVTLHEQLPWLRLELWNETLIRLDDQV